MAGKFELEIRNAVNKVTGKRFCPSCYTHRSAEYFQEGKKKCRFCRDKAKAAAKRAK